MWTWTLNWNKIREDLFIGSCPREPLHLEVIQEKTGVTALLSLQEDSCLQYWGIDYPALQRHAAKIGLELHRCPMRDMNPAEQAKSLHRAIITLDAILSEHEKVYVHCTAGLGRAPITVVGYLVLREQVPEGEAYGMVKRVRTDAVPAPEALNGCRQRLVDRHRAKIEQQAYQNYRDRLTGRRQGDSATDWHQAEASVLSRELASIGWLGDPPGRASQPPDFALKGIVSQPSPAEW